MFCAAIPATLALGAKAKARQKYNPQKTGVSGETRPKLKVPAGPATALVVSGLVVASLFYHTHLS